MLLRLFRVFVLLRNFRLFQVFVLLRAFVLLGFGKKPGFVAKPASRGLICPSLVSKGARQEGLSDGET